MLGFAIPTREEITMKIILMIVILLLVGCQIMDTNLPTSTSLVTCSQTSEEIPTAITKTKSLETTPSPAKLTVTLTDTPIAPIIPFSDMFIFTKKSIYQFNVNDQRLDYIKSCVKGIICPGSSRFLCFGGDTSLENLEQNTSIVLGSLPNNGICTRNGKYYIYIRFLADKLVFYSYNLDLLETEEIYHIDNDVLGHQYSFITYAADEYLDYFILGSQNGYEILDRRKGEISYFDPPNDWRGSGEISISPSNNHVIFGIETYGGDADDVPLFNRIFFAEDLAQEPALLASAPEGYWYYETNGIDQIWSPDERKLSLLAGNGFQPMFCIITIATKEQECVPLNNKPGDYFGPVWSPDSKYVALAVGSTMWIYDFQEDKQFSLRINGGVDFYNSQILWK
jgi:hypothetical protein